MKERERAFRYCDSLAEIMLPDSLESIPKYAFEGCSALSNVALPARLTSIELGAFFDCNGLMELSIPPTVNSITGLAFDAYQITLCVAENSYAHRYAIERECSFSLVPAGSYASMYAGLPFKGLKRWTAARAWRRWHSQLRMLSPAPLRWLAGAAPASGARCCA